MAASGLGWPLRLVHPAVIPVISVVVAIHVTRTHMSHVRVGQQVLNSAGDRPALPLIVRVDHDMRSATRAFPEARYGSVDGLDSVLAAIDHEVQVLRGDEELGIIKRPVEHRDGIGC